MKRHIAVLPGDGIGPEVTSQAVKVLKKIAEKFNHQFEFQEGVFGASAIDQTGNPLPNTTLELCNSSDAILFGSIGDPKYDNDPKAKVRPEQGLLKLRKSLGLFANIRPVMVFESLKDKSPLKNEILNNVDFVVFRELTGGIYFGEHSRPSETSARDICEYNKEEIERIAMLAFDSAKSRKAVGFPGKVTLVDKANVLETSRLWRETIQEFSKKYPEIEVEYMYVDNASMQIIRNPKNFDVILTENMFGDILTDEASMIAGSLGVLPSASVGKGVSLFEPIHGSYPQAAGKNIANPIGAILSAAMLLGVAFKLEEESQTVYKAVKKTLEHGFGTEDINSANPLKTDELTDRILQNI